MRTLDEIAKEIKRLLKQHPELLNPPQGGQIRKRGRPATGYKVAQWAKEQGVSVRTMERVVRIARRDPTLLGEVDAGRMTIRDAERVILIDKNDPALLGLIAIGRVSIKEAEQMMKDRGVILLPDTTANSRRRVTDDSE